jgi:hypothetical protein
MVSQEWTKLQLESKEDLFFVFDGIKGRLEQKLDRVSQAEAGDKWSELKQVFNQKAAGSQDFERLVNEKLTKVDYIQITLNLVGRYLTMFCRWYQQTVKSME